MQDNLQKNSAIQRFLRGVEWLGNLLPHPIILFMMMCVILIVVSAILSSMGVSVSDPRPNASGTIEVKNLLSAEGVGYMVSSLVKNFTGFAPLGTVLVAMLGVGIAEASGLISAGLRGLVIGAPKKLVTFTVVFCWGNF